MGKKSTHKGLFVPKHPEKYKGPDVNNIIFRSSWELAAFKFVDSNSAFLAWQSEGVSIPYRNPLTGKHTVYIPDMLVVYQKKGKNIVEMWEIKPAKETPGYLKEQKITRKDRLSQELNMAKWQAAAAFCAKRHIKFRILTEYELFPQKVRR